ncbi:MAG TPA: hypothetical protein VIM56_15475 [Rhizomicrobium sp.]
MKSIFGMSVMATAMGCIATFANAPAQARTDFSISIGVPNAVNFDYGSGGYCDSYGCPDEYWDFPVWYGPVYWRGTWYRGPLYYRDDLGDRRVYWIAGGWHHDQWRGSRPDWWYRGHYYAGPALGYSFYLGHGFRHDRDRYWRGNDWRPGRDWHGHHDDNVNIFFGGKDHDRHDRDNRNDRHDHDNWSGHDRHDHDNWSGYDRHDHDNWNGQDRHDDHHGHGMVTTTMSPATAYAIQTGNKGHKDHASPSSSGPAWSGASGGHHDSGSSGSHSGGDHHDHNNSSNPPGNDDHHHHH